MHLLHRIEIIAALGLFWSSPLTGQPAAPSPVVAQIPGSQELPIYFRPMDAAPFFDSNEPQLIPDLEEFSRLKFQMPQWLRQIIAFPPVTEIRKFLGKERPGDRAKAAESIRNMIAPSLLNPDFPNRMIPLARWAVLYEDWASHGGTDVYLVKFVHQGHVLMLLETHNHVLLAIRKLKTEKARDLQGAIKTAYGYAEFALTEHIKPVSPATMKTFRTSFSPLYVYGYYQPRIDALTGKEQFKDLITTAGQANETFSSANATAVRFFCNGDFAAFMILKPVLGAELKNPFEARFQPTGQAGNEKPFWEQPSSQVTTENPERTRTRQVEEYLGNFFYDSEGQKISNDIPVQDLERAFLELSPEQKTAIVQNKVIDEYYVDGLKAYAAKNYDSALDFWVRILELDPENGRAAILLQLAIKARATESFNGNTDSARRDKKVAAAQDAIFHQQSLLSMKAERVEQKEVRKRAMLEARTRAIDFWSEGNYADSLTEWKKILSIDPGNATALLFRDLSEKKLRHEGARITPANP